MKNICNFVLRCLLSLLIFVVSGCNEQACMDITSKGFIMSNELALKLTKDSLIKIGIDISKFEPVPYGDNPNELFARNKFNQNSGYILWHEKNKNTKFEYSVSIEQNGSKIYCDAGKTL